MNLKYKLLFSLGILITGCAAQQKIVYVPTPVKCPAPNIPSEPDYPVNHLKESDKGNYAKIWSAYVYSYQMCKVYGKSLNKHLEAYKHD